MTTEAGEVGGKKVHWCGESDMSDIISVLSTM